MCHPYNIEYFSGLAPNYESIHEENEVEALYASKHLREDAIKSFVKKLDNLEVVPIDSGGFTRELHRHGINVRLLGMSARHLIGPKVISKIGLIATSTKLPYVKDLCNVEIVARCCKLIFNDKIRKAIVHFGDVKAQKVEEEMKSYTLQLFMTVLGNHEQSRRVSIGRRFQMFSKLIVSLSPLRLEVLG
jgi:hypothetical protein